MTVLQANMASITHRQTATERKQIWPTKIISHASSQTICAEFGYALVSKISRKILSKNKMAERRR